MKNFLRSVPLVLLIILVGATSALSAANYYNTLFVKNLGITGTAISATLPAVGATACATWTPTVNNVNSGDIVLVAVPNTASQLTLQHNAIGTGTNTVLDRICNPTNVSIGGDAARTYIYVPIRPAGY